MRLSMVFLGLLLAAAALADENCATYTYCETWSGTCATGQKQSPIANFAANRTYDGSLTLPGFYYGGSSIVTATNTKTTLKITTAKALSLTYAGESYPLVEFHFHVPVEHLLDVWLVPPRAVAELHLVHKKGDKVVVVAVPITIGASNGALKALQALGPIGACTSKTTAAEIPMGALLPAVTGRYITYVGSLTTPPCTEGVRFILMNDGITATKEEINYIRITNNARPVQDNSNAVTYRVARE